MPAYSIIIYRKEVFLMPVNLTNKSNISIVVKKEVHAKLKELSEKDNRSVSSYIANLIDKHLKEIDKNV